MAETGNEARMTDVEAELFTLDELLTAADVFGADAVPEGIARISQAEEVPHA